MKRISIAMLLAATACAVPACTSSSGSSSGDDDGTGTGGTGTGGTGTGSGSADQYTQILNSRTKDFSAALKIAALRLTGNLPSVDEINSVANAPDDASKKTAYETLLKDYMSRPGFSNQMLLLWRDIFKTGGTAAFDTAATFAAQLTVTNDSYMKLFTATAANCPTLNAATGVFTPAECGNGGTHVGVLTDPGLLTNFFSNLAFRRTRFVQETFDCLRFPAEIGTNPTDVGGESPYLGIWPFNSISSPQTDGGRINFQDVSSAICANCHTTINHIAPLLATYDANGAFKTTIAVPTPLPNAPLAQLLDYIPTTETTAWRYQKPAADLTALGAALAADPDVAACGVSRIWNWALGKDDIVDALETVPVETIQTQLAAFTTGGFKLKDMMYSVFDSDDFVSF